ncbi:MAG: endo-1,4-beta-xylanase [Kiritimatiellaeota bacterium]|nr:endo-1,4-beta-xylanase [Kiritimatiellota bacterium]
MKTQRVILTILGLAAAAVADDPLEQANARIEKHRKETCRIRVTKNGAPVPGATVRMDMVRNEFLFGCNIFKLDGNKTSQDNQAYAERFAGLFNFATLGFYWSSYEWKRGSPGYDKSGKVSAWCKTHGIRTKGHPLVWNTGDPGWLKPFSVDEVYGAQLGRAAACAERFRGTIDVWDVINEVTEWQRDEMWKKSPKLTELGKKFGEPELVKASFAATRAANPAATLLINDYVLDDRYAALLDKLNAADGKPIFDAIGLQTHTHVFPEKYDGFSNAYLWAVCERFARFGVPLHFTEMTIVSTLQRNMVWDKTATSPEGEAWQRDEVIRIYTLLFSHPSVAAITWWDFSDQGAWMGAPAGLLRADMTPKPAYDALTKLVRNDWATHATLTTDADGSATLRAFRGDYRLTATLPDGTQKEITATVRKGDNPITLTFSFTTP